MHVLFLRPKDIGNCSRSEKLSIEFVRGTIHLELEISKLVFLFWHWSAECVWMTEAFFVGLMVARGKFIFL